MIRRPLAILTALSLLLAGPACYNIDEAWQFGAAISNGALAIAVAALSDSDDDNGNGNGNEGTPGAPTGLEATAAGEDQIDLAWTAPADNGGSDITGYRIEYRQGDGDWTEAAANTESTDTEYEHTGLTAATQYSYRVSAINENGTGPASEVAMATTVAMGTPAAPTNLSASAAAEDQIDLSWTAPADDGGSAITGYRVEYKQGDGDWMDATTDTGTTDTEYEHTGLTAAASYSYRVSAINANGTGVASDVAMATTVASGTPEAPTSLTATASGASQIDLAWTAPTDDGGSAITGYRIEYRQGSGAWMDALADTGSADTEYEHTSLMALADYSYRVSAINANGSGPASEEAMATTEGYDYICPGGTAAGGETAMEDAVKCTACEATYILANETCLSIGEGTLADPRLIDASATDGTTSTVFTMEFEGGFDDMDNADPSDNTGIYAYRIIGLPAGTYQIGVSYSQIGSITGTYRMGCALGASEAGIDRSDLEDAGYKDPEDDGYISLLLEDTSSSDSVLVNRRVDADTRKYIFIWMEEFAAGDSGTFLGDLNTAPTAGTVTFTITPSSS